MKRLNLVIYSSTGTDNIVWSKAISRLQFPINATLRSKTDLFSSKQEQAFLDHAKVADILIVLPHGGLDNFPELKMLVTGNDNQNKIIHIQPVSGSDEDIELSRYSTEFGNREFNIYVKYLTFGGVENLLSLLTRMYNKISGESLEFREPMRLPTEGIYHPDLDTIPTTEEYLAWARQKAPSNAPIIGIWFYQVWWVSKNLGFIDRLIKTIEAQGAIPLAVFHNRFKDNDLQNMDSREIIDKFFKHEGNTIIECLFSPVMFSLTLLDKTLDDLYPNLNCPVFQLICSLSELSYWQGSLRGLSPMDVSIAVAQPEFDGLIITTVTATKEIKEKDPLTGAMLVTQEPIPERVEKVVRLGLNWVKLRRTPKNQRRIAIIFHHYPPRSDRMGCAFGLDSFESVACVLRQLKQDGYKICELPDGEDLAQKLLGVQINDRRYLSPNDMAKKSLDKIPPEVYKQWTRKLPETTYNELHTSWGDEPGRSFCHEGDSLIGGIINGNIFIGLQPPRGSLEKIEENPGIDIQNIHDPNLPPTYHYLFFYRWLRDIFKAHAVIHVGKHGSLEWLPGKAIGLSEICYPDLSIMELPNLYPYIVNDPGEGTQAKRRSYAVIIDHMIPSQARAGKLDNLAEIERILERIYQIRPENPSKLPILLDELWEKVKAAHLEKDLKVEEQPPIDQLDKFCEDIHGYLNQVADNNINIGLHILGTPPKKHRMIETIMELTKFSGPDNPSFRGAITEIFGLNYNKLMKDPGQYIPSFKKTAGQIIEDHYNIGTKILEDLQEKLWPADPDIIAQTIKSCLTGQQYQLERLPVLLKAANYICCSLVPRLLDTKREIDNLVLGLDGGFVTPGASGCPTRGDHQMLPTGNNFFSVDPQKIPTPDAWVMGKKLADELLDRYLKEHGGYPKQLGIIIWGSPTMRTGGDDIAEALYLMGVRPVWHEGSGTVRGLKIIDIEELNRPRIDVTIRTSGFFRDAFSNLMELLDQAARMVAALNEPAHKNFLAMHVRRDTEQFIRDGMTPKEAEGLASIRVFSDRPGTYGAGINALLETSRWQETKDLGEIWIDWGGYGYGKDSYGKEAKNTFRTQLSRMDLTVKNQDSRELDILCSDDFNAYHGGMNAAVLAASGKQPTSYSGDSSNPNNPIIRSTDEETRFIFRSRVLNPKWIDAMMQHGYKGAGDLSRLVDICFQWDATSDVMDNWMYEELARNYALSSKMQDFFHKHNPDALLNITERLLEAIKRGMWQASEEMETELTELYLDMEGELEERSL